MTISLITLSSLSANAGMEIQRGVFSTNGGLKNLTYASKDVGSAFSGDNVIIQIGYSCDWFTLNNWNMAPITVTSDSYIGNSATGKFHAQDSAMLTRLAFKQGIFPKPWLNYRILLFPFGIAALNSKEKKLGIYKIR